MKKQLLITKLISILLTVFNAEAIQRFAKFLCDWTEEKVIGTEMKFDDIIFLPIIKEIRLTFESTTTGDLSKEYLINKLISAFFDVLSPESLKEFMDDTLDWIENKVTSSENKFDDLVVLPLCKMIRTTFSIQEQEE